MSTLSAPAPAKPVHPFVVFRIPEDTAYIDRSFETASWYDKLVLRAGDYRVEMDGSRALVRVPATVVETYRVNRLFTASSAETTYPNEETVKTFQFDNYEVVVGRTSSRLSAGTFEAR